MAQTNDGYDYASFVLADETIDYDVRANQPNLWKSINSAGYVRITSNRLITFKINKLDAPEIMKTASENPLKIGTRTLDIPLPFVDNLYISNRSGDNVVIGIYLGLPLDALTS